MSEILIFGMGIGAIIYISFKLGKDRGTMLASARAVDTMIAMGYLKEKPNGEIEKIVLGDLQSKRDYINVQEAVGFYETIMAYGKTGDIYNVGSGTSIKLSYLLERILLENDLSMNIIQTISRTVSLSSIGTMSLLNNLLMQDTKVNLTKK